MVASAGARQSTSVERAAIAAALLGVGVSGCVSLSPSSKRLAWSAQKPPVSHGAAPAEGAQAHSQTRRKIGAPYQAGGIWYVPAEQPEYDQVGLASWYGKDFQGRPTADGEIYEMTSISAAHATLPLPSIVEVVNLENGRRLEVRLNDRGPFHQGRIIDLSAGAAKALGFYQKGTARVRVRYVRAAPAVARDAATFTKASGPSIHWTPLASDVALRGEDRALLRAREGPYSVQVGAFANRFNAKQAASRLFMAGRAKVLAFDKGRGLYRVVIGPMNDVRQAESLRAKVAALGFAGARVISGA